MSINYEIPDANIDFTYEPSDNKIELWDTQDYVIRKVFSPDEFRQFVYKLQSFASMFKE